MRRPVSWVEREEDGVKVEIRVTFQDARHIRWQFQRADAARWEYDRAPTADQWQTLERKVEDRYRRRAAAYKDIEQVRRARGWAGDQASGQPDAC